MATASPFSNDKKREEYRRYLEKKGVMDAFTKVLVSLLDEPEKPEDALPYIIEKLSIHSGNGSVKSIQAKLLDAEEKVKKLEWEIQVLKEKECDLEGRSDSMD